MDPVDAVREVWLVAGNKGGVGKSAIAKSFVEWLAYHGEGALVVDGDPVGDIADTFSKSHPVHQFDLTTPQGWADFTDWICDMDEPPAPIMANLPDAVTEHTLAALERYKPSVDELGYTTRALFVMNTLHDGLELLAPLARIVRNVYPVKNLHWGSPSDWIAFNEKHARHYSDLTIFLPALDGKTMNRIRRAGLSYADAMTPRPDQPCSEILLQYRVSEWLQQVFDAFDEVLLDL